MHSFIRLVLDGLKPSWESDFLSFLYDINLVIVTVVNLQNKMFYHWIDA